MNGYGEEIVNIRKIKLLKSIQCMMYLNMNQKRTHLNYLKKGKNIDLINPSREITQKRKKHRRERNSYPADSSENRYNNPKAKKEGHLRKRCSEKCSLDLKTVHKYIPEKQYRQELDKIIWSNVTQKYYGWKKIPSKNKALRTL